MSVRELGTGVTGATGEDRSGSGVVPERREQCVETLVVDIVPLRHTALQFDDDCRQPGRRAAERYVEPSREPTVPVPSATFADSSVRGHQASSKTAASQRQGRESCPRAALPTPTTPLRQSRDKRARTGSSLWSALSARTSSTASSRVALASVGGRWARTPRVTCDRTSVSNSTPRAIASTLPRLVRPDNSAAANLSQSPSSADLLLRGGAIASMPLAASAARSEVLRRRAGVAAEREIDRPDLGGSADKVPLNHVRELLPSRPARILTTIGHLPLSSRA